MVVSRRLISNPLQPLERISMIEEIASRPLCVLVCVCSHPLTGDLSRRPCRREREKQIAAGGDGGHPA